MAVPRGVIFDIDGVLLTSWRPLPGAAEALAAVRTAGIGRAFLTNTTSRTSAEIAISLRAAGLDVTGSEIITAAKLTGEYLKQHFPGKRVWVLTSGPIDHDVLTADLVDPLVGGPDPDVVVLGGAGNAFTHDALSKVFEYLLAGLPVVAMHRSNSWQSAEGLRIDTGVYLEGLARAAGVTTTAVGKPAPFGFRTAAELMGLDPSEILMVGDDIRNDVIAAQVSGMRGVLVRTGKFRQSSLDHFHRDEYGLLPDFIIDTVGDLPELLGRL